MVPDGAWHTVNTMQVFATLLVPNADVLACTWIVPGNIHEGLEIGVACERRFWRDIFFSLCASVTYTESLTFLKNEEIGPLTGANVFEMSVYDVSNDSTWTPS